MSEHETIRIIAFDGSASSWSDWEVKFLARGQRKGFSGILKGTDKAPPASTVIDEKTAAGKEEKRCRDGNNYAYEEMLLSIQTKTDEGRVAFHIVTGSVSTDLPDGDAALAWERLKNKYAPRITPRKLELRREFQVCKLKNSEHDPEAWITHLEGLRMKLKDVGSTMTDEDLMVHILNNLTDDYEVQLSKLEEKLGAATNPLTIDDVKAELRLKYARMKAKKSSTETEQKDSEKALAATGKYKGTCTFCGKIGHKATDCYSRKNE